jgi:hypothetical protein
MIKTKYIDGSELNWDKAMPTKLVKVLDEDAELEIEVEFLYFKAEPDVNWPCCVEIEGIDWRDIDISELLTPAAIGWLEDELREDVAADAEDYRY